MSGLGPHQKGGKTPDDYFLQSFGIDLFKPEGEASPKPVPRPSPVRVSAKNGDDPEAREDYRKAVADMYDWALLSEGPELLSMIADMGNPEGEALSVTLPSSDIPTIRDVPALLDGLPAVRAGLKIEPEFASERPPYNPNASWWRNLWR